MDKTIAELLDEQLRARRRRATIEVIRAATMTIAGLAIAALIIFLAEKAIPQAAHDSVHHELREGW